MISKPMTDVEDDTFGTLSHFSLKLFACHLQKKGPNCVSEDVADLLS